MIRVLHVFARLGRGGLETFVMNLYRNIDRDKVQFDFLVSAKGDDYEQEVKSLGGRIFRVPPRNQDFRNYRNAVRDFFRGHAHEFEAVHLHTSWLSDLLPIKMAKIKGIPVRIIHSHSSAISKAVRIRSLHNILHHIGKMRVKGLATHYLGCSDLALDWMFKGTGVRSKAIMVNNGIDTSQFRYSTETRAEVREEFGLGNSFVIGHVGSFIPVKNHKFLVDLFRKIAERMPDVRLMLVGDGNLRPEIENQVKEYGLSDKVIFTGLRPDIYRLMQAFDILVMPSIFEGLPVSMVEAQSTGLPLIVSDTVSRDADLTGNVRYISLQSSLDAWADAVEEVRNAFIRKDGSRAVESKGFGIKGIARKMTQIYTGK